MKRLLLLLVMFSFLISSVVFAAKTVSQKKQFREYGKAPTVVEKQGNLSGTLRSTQTAPQQTNSVLIDSARNGYGFANSGPKSLDMTTDAGGNLWAGMAYRKFVSADNNSGIIGVAEFDVNAGFDYTNFTFWEYVNQMSNYGIGGRYPSFVAAPTGPVPIWTQYQNSSPDGSTIADAFSAFDVFGWGASGGGWTPPESWAQGSNSGVIHSLWLGCTDLYKDATGLYHLGGVWEIDLGSGDYTFIHGQSPDLQTWTWDNATVNWAAADFPGLNNPRFAWGSNGFGAVMTSGYKSDSPDQDFKIIIATTENYGQTWSEMKRYDWEDFGIPSQIVASDSIFIPDGNGGSVVYEGAASVGITYQFDLIVLPNNDIHIGCSLSWGPDAGNNQYYPNSRFMGLKDIHSSDKGQSWQQSTIWLPRGFYVADSTSANGMETLNEIDLGYDEQGNIYAAWMDRDPVEVVPAKYPRFDDRQTEDNLEVWASLSRDGGNSWSSPPLEVTHDAQSGKGGLRLATRTKWSEADSGKTYVLYQIPDYSRPLASPATQSDHVVWYYLAEAKGFADAPVSIEPLGDQVPQHFELFQNYPNPFNPETTIRFQLTASSDVSLRIYNALGEEVATLVDNPLGAGSYEISWDAANMASGVYFYKIRTSGYAVVKKMLLMK